MKPKSAFGPLRKSLLPVLALAAGIDTASSQVTRTWDGGGVPATNMDIAANWSGDTVPSGTAGDTAQWDGTVAGPLSLTYTAAGTGANLAGGGGIHLNIAATQTSALTLNEASGTAGLRVRDLTVASGAGALTLGSTVGSDYITLGSGAVPNHTWTNQSTNAVTFSSDVLFGAGGGVTHFLTLAGTGHWNVNTSLVKSGTGTINVIKDGTGTMNLGTVNSLGNAAFTIQAGTIDNTSGAALTLTNTAQTWNGDFAYGTAAGTNLNDLSLGAGTVSLGTAAGSSRTITTHGAGLLTAAGIVSNGTTANSLVKSGTGGLRLDGANTFSGGFTLNAGSLHIGSNLALGTGPLTIQGGLLVPRLAARTLANPVTVGGDFTLGIIGFNNQINFSGPVNLGGTTRTITVADTTLNPDANFTGVISNGGLTKAGAGTMVLTGANTYTGATTVNGGTLRVDGAGTINSSSGITLNGSDAKLLHTSSVVSTPAITVTRGTLDGIGTVGAVTLADSPSAVLANGNGTAATLTTGNLTFAGAATVNVASSAAGDGIAAGTLTTSGTDSAIILNITRTGTWSNGPNPLISFSSFPSADIQDFDFQVVSGPALGARQTIGDLVLSGNHIALEILGTSIFWTGLQGNQWTVNAVGGPKNWKQTSDNTATDYIDADDVVFNDTPGANQTIRIDDGEVYTTTTTFHNSAVHYTIASNSTFGIGAGTVTKNGTGVVTFNTNNNYSGGTTLNAGTIAANTPSALGTGALVINGGALDNTSGAPVTLVYNAIQTWNADFGFLGGNSLDMGSGAVTSTGAGDRTVTVAANVLAVGELKTAAGQGLIKQGAGTLALTSTGAGAAASVVNGVLHVAAGTIQMNRTGAPDAAGTGDLTANGLTGQGTVTNGSGYERWFFSSAPSGTFDFPGTLANGAAGPLGFNKTGASTQILSGSNQYTGATTAGGGTLVITGTNSGGGAVYVNGSAAIPALLNLRNGNALGTSVVTCNNRNSGIQLQGGITLPAGVTFITSNDGTSGATVPCAIASLDGNNTINGTITLTSGGGGTVIQSDAGSLTLNGNITIAAAQTSRGIILQGASTEANTFNGVLSDLSVTSTASITKNGSGIWTLTGANTYTGPTAVNAGTLVIRGNQAAATGPVTVAAGATLGGQGRLGGNVTIAANGIHSLVVAADSAAQTTRIIGGALTHESGSLLHLESPAAPAPGTYTLITANGGISGLPSVTGFTGGVLSISGNSLILTVANPSAYAGWATAKGLSEANQGPAMDPDSDGVSNLLEFALDGNPLTADPGRLPVARQDADHFIFEFDRRDDSVAEVTLAFEYGTNLASWPSTIAIPSDNLTLTGPPVGITDNGGGTHHVKITVPKNGSASLFGRLKAVK